jgi:hypothetical protein
MERAAPNFRSLAEKKAVLASSCMRLLVVARVQERELFGKKKQKQRGSELRGLHQKVSKGGRKRLMGVESVHYVEQSSLHAVHALKEVLLIRSGT